MTAGVFGLVGTIIQGPRMRRFGLANIDDNEIIVGHKLRHNSSDLHELEFKPNNIGFVALGTLLIWVGW